MLPPWTWISEGTSDSAARAPLAFEPVRGYGRNMGRPWVAWCVLVVVGLCAACSTVHLRHPSFVEAKVSRLEVGQTTDEVRALFGEPDRTEVMRCGAAWGPPWPCQVWTYELTGSYTNLLVFRPVEGVLSLDSWLLGRVYDKGYDARGPD
jgi:hypothetical protein